jgi:glyoxylase-like metal-dependent hydrolase (beta-lactamase superfamily II)
MSAAALTRRTLLRSTSLLAGGALLSRWAPGDLWAAQAPAAAKPPAGLAALDARRAEMAKAPIQRTRLADNLELLSGPGGNVVVLHGADGLHLVDNFVKGAWPQLKVALDAIGGAVKVGIDTHWHFDHADNNASVRQAGGTIVAHAKTKQRLSEAHDVIGLHMDPEPAEALPTVIFKDSHVLGANGEDVVLQYLAPAHTDTDILVLFNKANVIHLGDLFFNGFYPFIDASTGGNIDGMVAGAERALGIVDGSTKIVPGHGPLGDRAALQSYQRMLATIRDRVGGLKASRKSLAETQAAKPSAEYDAQWGNGFMKPDDFVALVYATL